MPALHANVETLRAVYADLRCIDRYVDDDVVLHTADRGASGGPAFVIGKKAVLEKELDLIRLTNGSLVMDVQHITANEYFGAVIGTLRARSGNESIGMPFCGLWRFRDGRIIEHWENAYDASALGRFLMGDISPGLIWLDGRNTSLSATNSGMSH
ncbi:nuclear transport factor 2 family protein [Dyella jejuensis]|uniref:Nuclear transport factor 2 family protein n=1 Tax=Dyella jejuensis TaxID=1432009 RepID=A0ABW8JEP2_9GAMM